MVTGINTSGISVGKDGKVNMSGLNSSIDWKAIVDAQMAAKRQPAVKLETKISANTEKITAYAELKAKTLDVTAALDKLRGTSGLSSTNVFKTKTASGVTGPVDGAPSTHVPSAIGDLVTASISQTAPTGNHTIVINQVAKAQQIRTDVQTSSNTALGLAGTFTLNGKTVTVAASDTLLDVRSKINGSGAGVTSTVVSSNSTSHYLVLSSNKTGTDSEMDFGGGNALTDALGLTDASGAPGGPIKNELVEAKNAILTVDGIPGITRQTNEIDDVLEGVTLQVVKAEANTEITLKVEPDLNAVKTAIVDLVEAYNALRDFATDQKTSKDRNDDGTVGTNEVGSLAYDNTMRQILAQLGNMAVTNKGDAADGFQSLSQIGITINEDYKLEIDDTTLDNRLITNVDEVRKMFAFDSSTSDSRLTVMDRTSDTQAGTYFVNIGGTDANGMPTTANIKTASGQSLAGLDDGSIQISGNVMTVVSGPAKGLKVYFTAEANQPAIPDIQVTISRGVADQYYSYFNDTTAAATGSLDTLSTQLSTESAEHTLRIASIDERLAFTRASLEAKFIAMEAALAQMESLKKTLTSYFEAGNSD